MKRKTDKLLYGEGLFGDIMETETSTIGKRFIYPPFSVLSARDGFWQERKRAWLAMGIKSELGRGVAADGKAILFDKSQERLNKIMADKKGKQTASLQGGLTFNTTMDGYRKEGQDADGGYESGTSIFDPVLVELLVKWFCPQGGSVLDPFAGGSVRGIVSAAIGREYCGCELRAEQVEANRIQWEQIKPRLDKLEIGPVVYQGGIWYKKAYMSTETDLHKQLANVPLLDAKRLLCENAAVMADSLAALCTLYPQLTRVPQVVALAPDVVPMEGDVVWQTQGPELCRWWCDDSQNIVSTVGGIHDFLLTCPPYADLEVYSDDERDISNMDYPDFLDIYRNIARESVKLMDTDTFAAVVVGEVRDKKGFYYNFVGDTIKAYCDAGLQYYNEIVLMTAVGSLPIRITNQFNASRKIGKTHQNILVFVKGDPSRAAFKCGRDETGA